MDGETKSGGYLTVGPQWAAERNGVLTQAAERKGLGTLSSVEEATPQRADSARLHLRETPRGGEFMETASRSGARGREGLFQGMKAFGERQW